MFSYRGSHQRLSNTKTIGIMLCIIQADPCHCDLYVLKAAFSHDMAHMSIFPAGLPCKYNNSTHQNGDSFKSTDGCNTCTCSYGMVACTEMACIKPIVLPDGSPEQ